MNFVNRKDRTGRQSLQRSIFLKGLSEVELLKHALGSDVGAFEELVCRTEDGLYRVAMRYVRDESDAQEILQNSYLSAWRSLPTFEGRAQFGCWMHRITVNASLMFLRTRSRHQEIAFDDVEPMELNDAIGNTAKKTRVCEKWPQRPDDEYQSAELLRRIEIAVNALPERLRATFVLREVKEMSTEDTAGELGASIPAIKTRLHRARRVLRESLGNYVAC
jgi:RNA polymerase sigma-70 factor, ECF subfamily